MKKPIHGGRLIEMETRGENPLDFSANINPWGPPPVLRKQWNSWYRYISLYPPLDWEYYQKRLADLYRIPKDFILPLNGATQGIYLLARLFPAQKVCILEPSFTEYARAFSLEGKKVIHCKLWSHDDFPSVMAFLEREKPQLVVLGNPCNPLGYCLSTRERSDLFRWCCDYQVTLLVDEAFQDFIQEETSFFPQLNREEKYTNLIIVRSLTKYFALAGLRSGCLLARPTLIIKWLEKVEPWNLNSLLAITLDLLSKSDLSEFHFQTHQFLKGEKQYIEERWMKLNDLFELQPSLVNYYTVKIKSKPEPFYLFLQHQGLLVRPLGDFWSMSDEYFRFSVRTHEENIKLIEVISHYARSL